MHRSNQHDPNFDLIIEGRVEQRVPEHLNPAENGAEEEKAGGEDKAGKGELNDIVHDAMPDIDMKHTVESAMMKKDRGMLMFSWFFYEMCCLFSYQTLILLNEYFPKRMEEVGDENGAEFLRSFLLPFNTSTLVILAPCEYDH